MFFLRLAALLAGTTSMMAANAHAQAIVKVDVGYNQTLVFRDETSGSTSSSGNPATTRIHEGDTVQFIWQGSNHNITPYDTVTHSLGYPDVLIGSSTIMTSSTWIGPTRLSTYRCTVHSSMTGQIVVFEVAKKFAVSAPATVTGGSPFNITVSATGQSNTTDALFRGTIRFSSSDTDPGVQLPGNYTFVAADNGTRTFTGLVLKTPSTARTITVSEVGGAGLSGQATLRVNGSAPRPPSNIRVIPQL